MLPTQDLDVAHLELAAQNQRFLGVTSAVLEIEEVSELSL